MITSELLANYQGIPGDRSHWR